MSKGDRYNKGKLRWRNFPLFLFRPVVEVADAAELREGNPTGKYETFNFLKGLDGLDTLDCLMRHLDRFIDPNEPDIDPEDGKHHLAKVAWNALVLLHHIQTKPELDTRYKPEVDRTQAARRAGKTDVTFEVMKKTLEDKVDTTTVEPKVRTEDVYIGTGEDFRVIQQNAYISEPKENKSEYQEMAEKLYMYNMSGHKIDMGNMQLAADIGEEDEEISD